MNVYSFYKKITFVGKDPRHSHSAQLDLINLWKESWSKYGWNPIVLGMDDIKKDDFFWKYYNVVSKLPTHNPLSYEIACWISHISFYQASIRNNDDLFASSDYDMINYGLTPDMFPKEPCYYRHYNLWPYIQSQETISTFINLVIDKFTNQPKKYLGMELWKEGKYHTSDMDFAAKLHEYDELPGMRNLEKENIYVNHDGDEIIAQYNKFKKFPYGQQLDEIKSFFKERWKYMNFIHVSGAEWELYTNLYEKEINKEVATKADIVRFINKSNVES